MSETYGLFSTEKVISPNVLDIGGSNTSIETRQNLDKALKCRGYIEKPLFYEQLGWDAVSDGSRQTRDECEILQAHGQLIASIIHEKDLVNRNCLVVELGPGDFTKTEILLEALHKTSRNVLYMAVDINVQNLTERIPCLRKRWRNVDCFGLWGSFDQALEIFERNDFIPIHGNRHVWSFGSSLTNDNEKTVIDRLERWSKLAESIIFGQDGTTNPTEVAGPYNTREFQEFFHRGLQYADTILQQNIFSKDLWETLSEFRSSPTMHIFTLKARSNIVYVDEEKEQIEIKEGENLEAFASFKYGQEDLKSMVLRAGCTTKKVFCIEGIESRIFVVAKSTLSNEKQCVDDLRTS